MITLLIKHGAQNAHQHPRITSSFNLSRLQVSVHVSLWMKLLYLNTNSATSLQLGKSHADKLEDLRKYIVEKGAYGVVVSALDEVAWLFNLRGSDVECNPVFYSYAIISKADAVLYVDPAKVPDAVKEHLGSHVTLKPYDAIFDDLRKLSETLAASGEKLIANSKTSLAVEVAAGKVIHYMDQSING